MAGWCRRLSWWTDVAHARHAVDLLLEGDGDGGLDDLRVGADVVAGDGDLRGRELGIERDGQGGNADRAGKDNEQRANRSEDRPADKEVNKQGERSSRGTSC